MKTKITSLLAIVGLFISCSSEETVSMTNEQSNSISNDFEYVGQNSANSTRRGGSEDLTQPNNLFNQLSKEMGVQPSSEITAFDDSRPENLEEYLRQLNKQGEEFDYSYHTTIDTQTELGVVNTYTLRYSSDSTKFLVIYETNFIEGFAYDMTMSIVENKERSTEEETHYDIGNISRTEPIIIQNPNQISPISQKFSTGCFKRCILKAVDPSQSFMGLVILGAGSQGWWCPPCGAVAGIYGTVALIGCGGGCNS